MKFGVPHFQTWTGLSALPMPCHHCCVVDVCLVWGRSITGPSLAHHRSISGSIGYSWSCTSWVDPLWVGPKISRNKVAPEIQIKRIGFVPSSTRPKQHLFIFVQTFWYYIRCIHPYASFLDWSHPTASIWVLKKNIPPLQGYPCPWFAGPYRWPWLEASKQQRKTPNVWMWVARYWVQPCYSG